MGFDCLKAIEPLPGNSLLSTTSSPEIPCTHLIDIGMMKKCSFTLKNNIVGFLRWFLLPQFTGDSEALTKFFSMLRAI